LSACYSLLEVGRRIGLRRIGRDPEGASAGVGALGRAFFGLMGLRDVRAERADGARHNRMPVILPDGARERWLDPSTGEDELRALLAPLSSEEMEAYEISTFVNCGWAFGAPTCGGGSTAGKS